MKPEELRRELQRLYDELGRKLVTTPEYLKETTVRQFAETHHLPFGTHYRRRVMREKETLPMLLDLGAGKVCEVCGSRYCSCPQSEGGA